MAEVGTAAAWLLAVVFAVAGVAKARRPRETAGTFRRLGVPAPHLAARLVPAAELALACALPVVPAPAGGLALVALAGFTLVLVGALRRGTQVACGCFGSSGAEPVGPADLVRNGLLGFAALVAVVAPLASGAPLDVGLPTLPALVAAGAAAVIGAVVLALVRVGLATGRLLDATVPPGPKGLVAP